MKYRYLGRSALKISPLCLGAMMFGGETDEPTSRRIIDKAFDAGVNFIDTADVYHAGRSEEIVGRAIAARRDHWVVATKFGFPFAQGPNARGVLTGKYAVDAPPAADTRAGRGDKRLQQTEWRPESLRVAQAVARHAQERGTTSVAFALAWVLKNGLVSAAIAGP
jgi:aryl-alcohol dehydrogenase-like predicted oxidoreductase